MKKEWLSFLILLGIIVFLPQFLRDPYLLSILNFAGINAMVALGLVILMGYAGQASLGQNGFFGAGAYISAILSLNYKLPIILCLFGGILVSATLAILIALPSLKLRGHYLAVATLAFGEIAYIVFNELGPGGPSGFGGIPSFNLFGWQLTSQVEYFYLIWGLMCLLLGYSYLLIKSPQGLLLKTMHESEQAITSVGLSLVSLKVKVFVLSAIFAGLAGGIYAHYVTFISPASFSIFYSIQILIMAVVGGLANLPGAIVGSLVMTSLPEVLRIFKDFDILVYGSILTLCLLYLRKGILGMVQRWI